MIGIFKRRSSGAEGGSNVPGAGTLALRSVDGAVVPAACTGLVCDAGGATRRVAAGARLSLHQAEMAFCFHPGPYTLILLPFAAAPEIGLQVRFAVDSPDPRVAQQRFDLYLMSEAGAVLTLADFGKAVETALQHELSLGNLDLPPCTTLDEWNVFRAGFNQLLYTRFGVTVDDCLPLDLGDRCDYARQLLARALAVEPLPTLATLAPESAAAPAPPDDVQAMRRLFLELPCVMHGLRLAVLPPGQSLFRQHQGLLQRLDLVSLDVNTMPALDLVAPGQACPPDQQLRRAQHSARAVAALDEAWGLLARLKTASEGDLASLFDDADRIVANLERDTAGRRLALAAGETP
jgi:hypothetical protein